MFYLRALLLLKIQLKALNIYLHFVSKGVKQLHSPKNRSKVCSNKVTDSSGGGGGGGKYADLW